MQYDVIVIGAGQAGPGMASGFAGEGKRVALIEGDKLGGTCLNYGCRPTKALRASAHVAHMARRASEYGIETGHIRVDLAAVMARKNDIIGRVQKSFEDYMTDVDGVDIYWSYGRFVGKNGDRFQVEAGDATLEAPLVYLNTGTRPFVPPVDGIESVPYLTNESVLGLTILPEHLIIIGGSYVGLEFGHMFRRFGSRVSIIEAGERIASREDDDISSAITEILEEEDITIYTQFAAQHVQPTDTGGVRVTIESTDNEAPRILEGSHLLIASGRRPNTDNLNLESIGLQTDDRGYIHTDDHYATDVPGIWALGDINRRGAFTHTSYQDYEIAWDNHTGGDRSADERIMAYALFTDPPLGRVGMNEREARESGRNVLMATYDMADVTRARLDSETKGKIKLLVDADTEEFLGAAFLGMHGDDLVQIISNFMHTGASYKLVRDALPIHPTVAEFLPTILKGLKPLE